MVSARTVCADKRTRKIKRTVIFTGLALSCVVVLTACAHIKQPEPGIKHGNTGTAFYEALLEVYTGPLNHLQAVRRGGCPMYPSCSQYSRQAIARHGITKGWVMTMDRLIRCGRDETRFAPTVLIDGSRRYYDPVESNAIW